MNRLLEQSTSSNSYATFFYAQFDEGSGKLRYVNAGHNPPYIVRRGGASVKPLTVGGIALGMFPQWSYEEAVVTLERGDVFIAFTDGVVEAHDARDEEFGEERLEALLRRTAPLPAPEMMSAILDELRRWMGEAAQYDDLTFIVAKAR